MTDKLIRADTTTKRLKSFNIISAVALFFIILTAGFMIFQNVQLSEELSQKEIVSTAFAEGIQTMCSEEAIRDKYIRMCSIAKNYADQSEYLDLDIRDEQTPREIDIITCSDTGSTIVYNDGTRTVTEHRCQTEQE